MAHKKVVSRVLGKSFMKNVKVNALTYLRDVGHFRDRFEQDVMEADVIPWLIGQTQKFVNEMGSHGSYPDTLVGNYVTEKSNVHSKAVQAYADMIKARRAAEQKAREDKIAERLRKKAEKASEKKMQEIARLREEIKAKYVDRAAPVEEILKQDFAEIDGWS